MLLHPPGSTLFPYTTLFRSLESARPGMRWIVESLVPFERELSILVVRGADRQSCTYPLAENEHEEGILRTTMVPAQGRSEEHTSELQSRGHLVCRLLLEKKK